MRRGVCYVYIMAGEWSRVMYTGMTCDLLSRVRQHKSGAVDGFTKRYNLKCLVYYEETDGPRAAIEREKQLKGWTRARKLALIESTNPGFADLSADWYE